jgi:uncharacterized protein YbjT (DUF2867 family)
MDVLVLGARGSLGRLVCAELVARGHRTRTVSRPEARDAEALTKAASGAEAIINCAGASMQLGLGHGWRGYRAVDTPIGIAAATAARRVGVRLVYVGVHHSPAMAHCAYIDAHERVVHAMTELDGVVVRATGFFSAFASFLPMARRGLLVDVGRGRTRTNPIDEHDLAAIVAEAAFGDGPREIAAGGPQVMTRAEIFETIIAAANRRVRVMRLPVWLGDASAAVLRVVHPRIGQLGRFAAQLARHDAIAPALGTRALTEYFAALDEQPRATLRAS